MCVHITLTESDGSSRQRIAIADTAVLYFYAKNKTASGKHSRQPTTDGGRRGEAVAVDAGLAHWPPFAASIVCSLGPRKVSGGGEGSEALREILRVPLGTVSECLWCSCAKVQWFGGA